MMSFLLACDDMPSVDAKPRKKKLVTGRHRSFILTQEQNAQWEKLVAASGTNGNDLFRLLVMTVTPKDVRELEKRR